MIQKYATINAAAFMVCISLSVLMKKDYVEVAGTYREAIGLGDYLIYSPPEHNQGVIQCDAAVQL